MNRYWFDQQMGRMSALRGFPADTNGHFEVLAAVDTVLLDEAVGQALKTRSWFPTPAELLHDIDAIKPRQTWRAPVGPVDASRVRYETIVSKFGTLRIKVDRDWLYKCDRCTDTGQASWWCGPVNVRYAEWMEFSDCGRQGEHVGHEWVSRCACWASNPELIRKREMQAQYATQRAAEATKR